MRFAGNRAILGAIAMMIVGVVLSLMAADFLVASDAEEGMTRSRWWWEIVLNSQILCAAFIWFTHIDRITSASGRRVLVPAMQLAAGLVAVLLPVWFALAAASLGWFEVTPGMDAINSAILLCLLVWFGSSVIMWLADCYTRRRWLLPRFAAGRPWYVILIATSPMLATAILALEETARGGILHYIYGPFLLYLQGAVPYLARSVRFGDGPVQVIYSSDGD